MSACNRQFMRADGVVNTCKREIDCDKESTGAVMRDGPEDILKVFEAGLICRTDARRRFIKDWRGAMTGYCVVRAVELLLISRTEARVIIMDPKGLSAESAGAE